MLAKSRSARRVRLTRYAMESFEFVEELVGVAESSLTVVLKTLPDAFSCIGLCGDIEQSLIGLGVLHYGSRLAFDRQHHRALALPQLLHEVTGTAAERSQGLDVFGDVKHD